MSYNKKHRQINPLNSRLKNPMVKSIGKNQILGY
jgi:hypothetical protein